jgi:general secretion pathway protein G
MRSRRISGFSLPEICIVVIIIGLLASVVTVKVMKYLERAKIETTKANIQSIKTAITKFQLDVERLPKTLDELVKESPKPWDGPYLDADEVPKDGWKNDFRYEPEGRRVRVRSAGPDKQFDTDDDIVG